LLLGRTIIRIKYYEVLFFVRLTFDKGSTLMKNRPPIKEVKKTILLVDDDAGNRDIMSEMLSDMGYQVLPGEDAATALSIIQQSTVIDLVITDYQMPDMNGLDLAMALRQILPAVPVIMVTAYSSIENYFRSMSLGVFEYVNKPINTKEFKRVVRAALHEAA
jgi:DNA-binding NtrC family response regulator